MRHGRLDDAALAAELRLLAVMTRVVALVPVVVWLDAPLVGLGVPLVGAATARVVTERAQLRLAGSSLVGTVLGPLAHLPRAQLRYLAYAPCRL